VRTIDLGWHGNLEKAKLKFTINAFFFSMCARAFPASTQVRSYGGCGSDAGLLSMPSRRSDALDLGSSSLYNGKNNSGSTSNAPIFDHGTSRAVAAALGALQRKQQQLNDELAEKRAVVKQLEESLASATSASRDEDAALHQANLNEQSRSAVQVVASTLRFACLKMAFCVRVHPTRWPFSKSRVRLFRLACHFIRCGRDSFYKLRL